MEGEEEGEEGEGIEDGEGDEGAGEDLDDLQLAWESFEVGGPLSLVSLSFFSGQSSLLSLSLLLLPLLVSPSFFSDQSSLLSLSPASAPLPLLLLRPIYKNNEEYHNSFDFKLSFWA